MYLIIIIIIQPTFIERLLCARRCFRDITCSSSCNFNNNPMVPVLFNATLVTYSNFRGYNNETEKRPAPREVAISSKRLTNTGSCVYHRFMNKVL